MSKLCSWTNNRLVVESDGWTRPCCLESNSNAKINDIKEGILKSFNNKTVIKLNDELKNNGFTSFTNKFCNRCEKLENNSIDSLRKISNILSNERELKYLQLKTSNVCQLVCGHCDPYHSSSWAKFLKKETITQSIDINEKFLTELKTLLPNLSVLKFTGGEPFLDKNHWKILEYLKPYDKKHCELQYITNGLITPKLDLWKNWKKVKCYVSIDGFEETYEWFRRKANWHNLISNIKNLQNIADVEILFSITPYTFQDYFEIKKFFNLKINTITVTDPYYCSLEQFPKNIISKVKNWESIPNIKFKSNQIEDINIYVNWATDWDHKWNTPGKSNRLFFWML